MTDSNNDSNDSVRTPEQQRSMLRQQVNIFYDAQELRIQIGGRIRGKGVNLCEADIDELEKREEAALKLEKQLLKDIGDSLNRMPFYTDVLKHEDNKARFKGMGPTLAGVILSEVDIHRAVTFSKLLAFAGMVPVPCARCLTCNVVVEAIDDTEYRHPGKVTENGRPSKGYPCILLGKTITRDQVYSSHRQMRRERGVKNTYNAWFRSKLLGVLGPCLIKAGSPYRKFYDYHKARKRHTVAGSDVPGIGTPGTGDKHRHAMAMRYMVKAFLYDIWHLWRKHENLSIRPPYMEEYLGRPHHESRTVLQLSSLEAIELGEKYANSPIGIPPEFFDEKTDDEKSDDE